MKKRVTICFHALLMLFMFTSVLSVEGYRNFHVAIYCTVWDVVKMSDLERLEQTVDLIEESMVIDKVYLETHRRDFLIDEETLKQATEFFENRGIKTSGGITTTGSRPVAGHFPVYCYTDEEEISHLKEVMRFTAEHFDEIIIDDFFFTSCRCSSCIKEKGDLSWTEFRLNLMRDISKDVIIKTARETNPGINMIIKYPNWYDHYQYTGYNLKDEPGLFDMIYTGTETRDPEYHQQHIQPYQGYLIMRYLENVKPGKNGGGWVDPLDMGTWNRYAEQLALTLFAGSREITLFHFGSLTEMIHQEKDIYQPISMLSPVAGFVFEKTDLFLDKLGNPIGLPVYKPVNSSGEAYLPAYLGMIGIPIELTPNFPSESSTILLTASASFDPDIIGKMKDHLSAGKNLIITSGLLKSLQGAGINDIIEASYSDKKCLVDAFTDLHFSDIFQAKENILLPVIEFPTNDAWKEIAALSGGNSYPLVLQSQYGKGMVYILTIPDNLSDLYKIPETILTWIKELFLDDFDLLLEAPGKVSIFLYDNNSLIVHSFLPHKTEIRLRTNHSSARLIDLISGEEMKVTEAGEETYYRTILAPNSYRVLQWK